ncbi:MAG: pyridoxal phosphate-dependent aminotransferase, partial [Myxococcales bacterium]|nr:pyridoxal phosphate-dependent aminotransferase [Myxococcales bacterium]
RVIQARSFSKAYGMAGNRVGHLVGPVEAIERISRLATYIVYGACRGAQRAAHRALRGGAEWLASTRESYRAIGVETASYLGIEPPQGGTFHFFDVSGDVGPGGVAALLERCVENGLLVAPGASFGAAYSDYLRVCFTCSPPDVVRAGIETLARCLGR